jgi:cytochrome P450
MASETTQRVAGSCPYGGDAPAILDYPMPRTDPLLPPPAYAELRNGPPVQVRLPNGKEAWLLTRHADIRTALADPRLSSDFLQPQFPALNPVPPVAGAFSFFRMDAPEHTRLRRMVTAEFTPRQVRGLRPAIEELADSLIDAMTAGPAPADLVDKLALPLPSLVIATKLGVPAEDHALFQRTSRVISSSDATVDQATAAFVELTGCIDRLADLKSTRPQDDLLSRLVAAEAQGELTRAELVTMVALILFAGHETTANQIALSVTYLLRDPDQLAAIRADPSLLTGAVEELLRFASIKQHDLIRVAAADVEIAGIRIAAGQGVIAAMPSGNHDELAFPDPDRIDIRRETRGHLAFGHGAHACLGAALARAEIEIALSRLFTRLPGLRMAAEVEDLPFRHSMLIYGMNSLPVTW